MNKPIVSIITPMWKGAALVADTIKSVLSQDYVDWEMIVVDDCSPDDGAGAAVVQSYADKDSRIKLIRATVNRGSSGARNQAMEIAQGRYFAFLDSDDIWHPTYLTTMMKHISENIDESIAIFFASYRRMNSKCDAELLPPYIFEGKRTYKQLLRHCPIFPSAAIVDTEKLPQKVMFNEALKALRDDYAYWLEIMKNGLCAYGYSDILVDYRMREDSMTASKTKMIKPQWNIYRKVLKINIFTSAWYLFCWGINGLKKYKIAKKVNGKYIYMGKANQIVFLTIALFCIIACKNESIEIKLNVTSFNTTSGKDSIPDINTPANLWEELKLISVDGKEIEPFLVNDSGIHVSVLQSENISNLRPRYVNSDGIVKYGTEMDFSDFREEIELIDPFTVENPETKKVIIYDLPVLIINTPDLQPILSKEERVINCNVSIVTPEKNETLVKADIKGRGNSTWEQPKKPYNIKFQEKQSILGMKSSKNWILLANAFYDRTQLHNATAFELARLTNYEWVQNGKFVELILNGEHKGLYYLCEKIEVEKSKINIDKLKESDISGNKITGGYLLEIDNTSINGTPKEQYSFVSDYFIYTGTSPWFPNPDKIFWFLKEPDENVPEEQFHYIKTFISDFENLIADDDKLLTREYVDFVDLESVINWWLIEELALNEEASRTKNLYVYKKRNNSKLFFGPPWDLDAWTFGLRGTKYYCAKNTFWFRQLFKDPEFVNKVKSKWAEYKPIWEEKIPLFIDEQYTIIRRAAERNEKMWTDWSPVCNYGTKTYEQLIIDMKNSFFIQMEWMDNEINNM